MPMPMIGHSVLSYRFIPSRPPANRNQEPDVLYSKPVAGPCGPVHHGKAISDIPRRVGHPYPQTLSYRLRSSVTWGHAERGSSISCRPVSVRGNKTLRLKLSCQLVSAIAAQRPNLDIHRQCDISQYGRCAHTKPVHSAHSHNAVNLIRYTLIKIQCAVAARHPDKHDQIRLVPSHASAFSISELITVPHQLQRELPQLSSPRPAHRTIVVFQPLDQELREKGECEKTRCIYGLEPHSFVLKCVEEKAVMGARRVGGISFSVCVCVRLAPWPTPTHRGTDPARSVYSLTRRSVS
ncbi:hypothetical protein AG1IA_08877 [Rhizoctonia solani AG-1 IA]|uniref:Uncharacterized protein n=1 Tax=Thanatephorus cucumeris (strain AG1-IA) TaxID=983506 RepID=L8WFX1_THACA|nr:hypothetical protein AG1IA_08877 [Rhizoctonia solani AG-1 IA]